MSLPFSSSGVQVVGFQSWRNLLFIHWPVSAAALRRLVPRQLELDLYDGQAYVSLIPLRDHRIASTGPTQADGYAVPGDQSSDVRQIR
jgi:uncharacterized protein YqjF (DUF2071 family)